MGLAYAIQRRKTAEGDGRIIGLIVPARDSPSHTARSVTGTASDQTRLAALFLGIFDRPPGRYFAPRAFFACSRRSSFTHSFATGGLSIRPTPYFCMKSVVTWTCFTLMSY